MATQVHNSPTGDRTEVSVAHAPWFTQARFGMFIHWGLYSLGARHEWTQYHERIPPNEYARYAERFFGDRCDMRDWANLARRAGAEYAVLTTKHHEGFCLWDSSLTDFTSTATPAGRDFVAEFVDAAREAGLRIGFYHSLLDWHHPDFVIDGAHPLRDAPDVQALNRGRDMRRYRDYLHGQVYELLTRYGQIDYLFFDFSYDDPWHAQRFPNGKGAADWGSEELLAMVRRLQPGIVVNDRLGIPGDFLTPEQYQPSGALAKNGIEMPWEACQTLDGNWSYSRDSGSGRLKSPAQFIRMLVDGVAKNGNQLLNVGPDGRGAIDANAVATLDAIGDWLLVHERAIRGAGPSQFTPPPDCRYTQVGSRLYLHIFAWPFESLHLPGLAGKVTYAQLLNDGSEIRMRTYEDAPLLNSSPGPQAAGTLTLQLPTQPPNAAVAVIELFLEEVS